MQKIRLIVHVLFFMIANCMVTQSSAQEAACLDGQSRPQFCEGLLKLDEQKIFNEKQKFQTKFRRNFWVKNGLSAAATMGALGMFMAWSKGDIKYTFKDDQCDQKAFIDNFNKLSADQRYAILIGTAGQSSSGLFSWRSLTEQIIPYALGTASSTLVFNILQMLVQQPFGKFVNGLYYDVSIDWFLTSQSNALELFDALKATAQAISEHSQYQELMFIDLMNALTKQVERLLGLMYYELDSFRVQNRAMYTLGQKSCQQMKDAFIAGIADLLDTENQVAIGYQEVVKNLQEEFDIAIKQFHSFEASCN